MHTMGSQSSTAIRVRSLGKSYSIRHQEADNSAGSFGGTRRRPWRSRLSLQTAQRFSEETFWALRDIEFDVTRGKVFGVIGSNGAGKSTLLKILSRITDPTEGTAVIHGRVGSLLEVGTGFHPELTGRENIYLNGTLLGMRRREIKAVFDDIVDFAEVERFIDTPVKRYSSGMYVRLAFAVAAHLRPEILIIDEVLAVGDIGFQKKCLGKMQDVTGEGRTVLFVSHSLSTVNSLCEQCLLLEHGRVKKIGPTAEVTNAYFDANQSTSGSRLDFTDNPQGDDTAVLLTARLINREGNHISHARIDSEFGIEMTYEVKNADQPVIPNLHFFQAGTCAFVTSPSTLPESRPGFYKAIAWLPPRLLNEGNYSINIAGSTMNPPLPHFHLQDSFSFEVIEDTQDPIRHGYIQKIPGAVRPLLDWTVTNTRP
jgi:lipopolysaccharide transport system ATP-binding protein